MKLKLLKNYFLSEVFYKPPPEKSFSRASMVSIFRENEENEFAINRNL